MVIYTAVKGYLEDVPTKEVVNFQNAFLKFMRSNHAEIGKKIIEEKKLTDDTEAALKKAIGEFKQTFSYQKEA
jgi:F-type H+-transporting ATPase subunit alpha